MAWLISHALMDAYANLHFSPGQAEASLPVNCSASEPSVPSNLIPTPQAYSFPDKTPATWSLSRYGTTCEPLTESLGTAVLTWFQGAFHAPTSVVPANAPGSTARHPAFGRKWQGSLAKYDPITHSLKMPQTSLFGDLTESCATLPRWGLMRHGGICQRPQLAHRMKESAPGYLLPTPTVAGNGLRSNVHHIKGMTDDGKKRNMNLDTAMNLLPTLTVNGNHNRAGLTAKSGDGLQTLLNLLPTLCASDYKGPYSLEGYEKQMQKRSKPLRDTLTHKVGFRLSPGFAEWFMGWPLGWTMLPDGKEHKSKRIECLGNGQVPLCAAMAFTILWGELNVS